MSDAPTQALSEILERIYDAVEATLPGVAHPVVEMATFDAIEEFCVRSTYWRELVTWSMPVGVSTIDLNPLSVHARVQWILRVCGFGCGCSLRIKPTATLIDYGPLTEARTGTAWVVLKPTRLAATLPDWMQDWSEGLRDGVLFRLHAQPSKPYSNDRAAAYHGRRFRSQIQLARIEAHNLRECDAPRFPYFARGRGVHGWGISPCAPTGPEGPSDVGIYVPPVDPALPTVTVSAGVITTVVVSTPVVTLSAGVITGTSAGPAADLSVSGLTFGATSVSSSAASQTVTVTNSGDAPLVISAVTASGDFSIITVTSP